MCRGDGDRWQVVGVVDDMRQGTVTEPPQPELFVPFRQIGCTNAVSDLVVVVRTVGEPLPYAAIAADTLATSPGWWPSTVRRAHRGGPASGIGGARFGQSAGRRPGAPSALSIA